MSCVTSHVRGGCGVTSRTCNCAGSIFISLAGGGVSGKCSFAGGTTFDFTPCPRASGFNGFARADVFRMLFFKMQQHSLGAVGSPQRQRLLRRCFGLFGRSFAHLVIVF